MESPPEHTACAWSRPTRVGLRVKLPRPTHRYVPMKRGFVYLAVVVDWFSRRVLACRLSSTMETGFCTEALGEALSWKEQLETFNTNQGN